MVTTRSWRVAPPGCSGSSAANRMLPRRAPTDVSSRSTAATGRSQVALRYAESERPIVSRSRSSRATASPPLVAGADLVGHVVAVVAGLADGELVPGGVEEHVPAPQLEAVVALARPQAAGQLGVQVRQFRRRRVVLAAVVLGGPVEQVGERPPFATGGIGVELGLAPQHARDVGGYERVVAEGARHVGLDLALEVLRERRQQLGGRRPILHRGPPALGHPPTNGGSVAC